MPAAYDDFFRTATSLRPTGDATTPQAGNAPYDYQRRVARNPSQILNSGSELRESPFPCGSHLISACRRRNVDRN